MDEQENLLYFDKDDRLTYRGNGTPKRLSGTGDTEGKAKSAYPVSYTHLRCSAETVVRQWSRQALDMSAKTRERL